MRPATATSEENHHEAGIHPDYHVTQVTHVRQQLCHPEHSAQWSDRAEIYSSCHLLHGKQKILDTGSRVARFSLFGSASSVRGGASRVPGRTTAATASRSDPCGDGKK